MQGNTGTSIGVGEGGIFKQKASVGRYRKYLKKTHSVPHLPDFQNSYIAFGVHSKESLFSVLHWNFLSLYIS